MNNIRNFAIIAHVDHGKSTLADRFLELTGTVGEKHVEQMLDRNPISRERGITIKLAPVRMTYRPSNLEIVNLKLEIPNSTYTLNLIDTPGHVDFSYEVERTLACVEGVVLLVDATQGIQAQTIAHAYKAIEQNLIIVPAVNKIDLSSARVQESKKELADLLGISKNDVFEISAKTGIGVAKLLNAVIQTIPPPSYTPGVSGTDRMRQSALIFDSYYDSFRGVIVFVRLFCGEIKKGDKLKLAASKAIFTVDEVGIFSPDLKPKSALVDGEIGYVVTKLKSIHRVAVGDTIVFADSDSSPLPGYRKIQQMVFSSMFPTDPGHYVNLVESMEKLSLNDAALSFEPIYSQALGSGLRVGFLGLLHADVVRQRLEREFGANIILTAPTVEYRELKSYNLNHKSNFEEPIATVDIVTPQAYVGAVMRLCEQSRGVFFNMDNKSHVYLSYEIPLCELISTFFDRLKSITSGFASLNWEFKEYRHADVDRLIILLNGDPVEEFSEYIVDARAYERGSKITSKLKELIPRQQYEVKIQAQYNGKIIASSRIAPFRKDVTQKLYGGDRTRKDKLLKKQKEGKRDLKNVGSVEIPKEVFLKLFQNKT